MSYALFGIYAQRRRLPVWVETMLWTPAGTSSGWTGYTLRQRIKASDLAAGTEMRFTIDSAGRPLDLVSMYVERELPVPDMYDFAAPPTQVTFGGSATLALPSGGVVVSDPISFTQDGTDDLIWSAYFGGTTTLRNLNVASPDGAYAYVVGDQANDEDFVGAFEAPLTYRLLVTRIECR